jgi:hypothetical protein
MLVMQFARIFWCRQLLYLYDGKQENQGESDDRESLTIAVTLRSPVSG